MNILQVLLIVTLLLLSISNQAQHNLTGNLIDGFSGEPISDANIEIEGKDGGTSSDQNGYFSLTTQLPITLKISHLQYETQFITIEKDSHLIIELTDNFRIIGDETSTITITGRAINLKLPASLMQIHQEHLNRDHDVSIAPALNRVTGVFMHSGALNTNRITIRGIGNRSPFSTTKLRAYLDDIPLTNGDGETTIEDIDLSMIREVDVWKGPTASVFGAGLGGMIHLKTDSGKSSARTELKNALTVGSYGLLRNVLQGNYANDKNTLQVGLNINTTYSDGYRDNNEYDRNGGSLLIKYTSGAESETTFFGNLIDLKSFIPSSLNRNDYLDAPEKAAFTWANVNGFEDYSKHLFGLSHHFKLAEIGDKMLKNKTSIFTNSRDSYESRPFNILDEESTSIGLRSTFELRSKSAKNKKFPLLSLGIEAFRENYDWQTFQTNDGEAGALLSDNNETRKYINLFAQSYYGINDKATLFAGLNFNSTTFIYEDKLMVDGIDKSRDFGFDGIFSPHLGFNYQFDYKLALFATISHGFSPPSLSETLNPEGTINPDIAPEQGWNFEIGSRGQIASKFTYELTAYTMQIKDLLVARRVGEDQFIGLNAGKTQHKGVELFLEYKTDVSKYFDVTTFMTYTYSDYQFIDFVDNTNDYSGNELTGTPPHQLNAGIDFASSFGVYGSFNIRYVDAFPMRDDNSIYSESYRVSNIKLGYRKRLFDKLEIDLSGGIRNVFNEQYASMILINAGSFGGSLPRYYYPGLPRNYFASLSLNYFLD